MPKLGTLKSLGSLFRSSINSTPATTTTSAATAKTSPAVDKSIKHFVSSLDASSASTFKRTVVKSQKRQQPSKPPSPAHFSSLVSISVDTSSCSDSEDPTRQVSHDISSILSEGDSGGKPSEDALEEDALEEDEDALEKDALQWEEDALEVPWKMHWYSDMIYFYTSLRRKLSSRERKQKSVLKKEQVNNVNHFVDSCVERLGIDAAVNVFRKLGRETGMKEFNALLKICRENAITADDETFALEQVSKAFKVLMYMKEQGFPIEEESYREVLLCLIDRGMVEQFHLFTDVIKDGSASTLATLGIYEMLLDISLRDAVSRVRDGGEC